MEGHPYVRRLSVDEFRLVADLTNKHVAPRDILSTLKEQNENNVSTIKTIYNAQQKIRMHEQAGRTPMQVLMSLLHINNYLYEFTTGDSNELENLFFVHPMSWNIWRAFPHVLIIDATYKTNAYNKPFVQIVGVTSTQKTFSIAFVFMHREKEANYTWALNCLKLTLDECMHPRVIVTDRELALINACETVFPNAARLLCRWHIEQNITKHCNTSMRSKDDRESFRALWNLLVDSPTWIAYVENYNRLQSMLINYPRFLSYVEETWLQKYKEMLVSVWVDQHLNFGNRTTNRVESQHVMLKKYLNSANSKLDKFVKRINQIVQSQLTSINESFEKNRIYRYNQHNLLCFKLLRGKVSNEALDIILGELQRLNASKLDSSNCGCQLYNSCGLPCACMLYVYSNSGECIPLDSINITCIFATLYDAFTVGFDELHESLCWTTSPAYLPHYMIMPLTGYLIANKFRMIVHCLSHEQSMTCFSLWRGPEECQLHRTITLANVYGNHYMSVYLKENYPMPPTTMYWNSHRSPSAFAWKTIYRSRFELYYQLRPRSSVTDWIHIKD